MAVQQIEKSQWLHFFDRFSQTLRGRHAEVEVASIALGDQQLASAVPLLGISCDGEGGMIDIHLQGEDHRIENPASVAVDYAVGGLVGLEIVAGDGSHAIIKLTEPVMLPAPELSQH